MVDPNGGGGGKAIGKAFMVILLDRACGGTKDQQIEEWQYPELATCGEALHMSL